MGKQHSSRDMLVSNRYLFPHDCQLAVSCTWSLPNRQVTFGRDYVRQERWHNSKLGNVIDTGVGNAMVVAA